MAIAIMVIDAITGFQSLTLLSTVLFVTGSGPLSTLCCDVITSMDLTILKESCLLVESACGYVHSKEEHEERRKTN